MREVSGHKESILNQDRMCGRDSRGPVLEALLFVLRHEIVNQNQGPHMLSAQDLTEAPIYTVSSSPLS